MASMLDEIAPKTVYREKEDYLSIKKRNTKLNNVELVENINRNSQSFLEISPSQKEVLPSHKLQNHACQ